MIAKFDSYRQFETPALYVCNPGCKLVNGMLTNVAGVLTDITDIEFVPNFNATSLLNLRAWKLNRADSEENEHMVNLFRSLRNRKMIYAEGIGFFVITNVEDGYDRTSGTYKDIEAESCEVEMRQKGLPYIEDGTYKFYTGEEGNLGMIERLVSAAPLWTIGTIDQTVVDRYRTFEDLDFSKNILGFMLEDLQDAYECIFIFDIQNRIIDVYDQANYVHTTDIHLTKDDFINKLNVSESSDELYTALSVKGENDLSINAVNPLGSSVIYNFDYYLDWMSDNLKAKVSAWQDLVDSYSQQYYNVQISRYGHLTSLSTLNAELDALNTQVTMYKRCRENIVAESSPQDIASYNEVIASIGGIEIPEDQGYLWVMYADDSSGTNISSDPYGKNYIGLSYDNSSSIASLIASDYSWYQFRSGQTFPHTVDGATKYTWVVFADSVVSGMSNNPDEKAYIGVAIDRQSSTKSTNYSDYTWSLIESGGTGISEALGSIIDLINQGEDDIASKQAEIDAMNATISSENDTVANIQNAVSFQNYFTSDEMDELSNYIIEGSYEDEYITITESMTYAEQFEQIKTLYDRGIIQLEKASQPTQEFTIDSENFIFVQEFADWSDQLETGCLINVELDDNDVAMLFLTSFSVNYEDKTLSMTFGNRYNRFDPQALFNKVLGNISKTSNTLAYIRDTIYPVKNGAINALQEALDTSRTLTKNSVLSAANEQVIIDDTGYTGRRRLSDGTLDPHQIKINGRNIVFTDDAWETCKTAIGEIILGDGASKYGINAEILLGEMIYGGELHIIDENGVDMFQVTEDRAILRLGTEFVPKAEYNTDMSNVSTQIEANKQGILQNTEYYEDLNGQLSQINAYIQTGVISKDENGSVTYGVKIGQNLASMDVYIRSGATALSSSWLSATDGGVALTPNDSVLYRIQTQGAYFGQTYRWNGTSYEQAESAGTLSSVFTSSELGFYDTGEKTAYFSNKALNVKTIRTGGMLLSNNVMTDVTTNSWLIGTDNGYYLKWVGA